MNSRKPNRNGTVSVTQTIPAGWDVVDAAGGVITSTGAVTYIVWTAGAGVTAFTPQLASPTAASGSACNYCGNSAVTSVQARANDCQNCSRTASASAITEIQCNLWVAGKGSLQHLPIPGFEDVQGQLRAREEDEAGQRKDRQYVGEGRMHGIQRRALKPSSRRLLRTTSSVLPS